jgi:hypothetical protein
LIRSPVVRSFGSRYKPVGWRGESHRHYLASKGIKTSRGNYLAKIRRADFDVDVRGVRVPPVPSVPSVRFRFVDEPGRFDSFVESYRRRRGLDPENVVLRVQREGRGPRQVIQVEDFVRSRASELGVTTKEEFAKYHDEVVAGAHQRGVELGLARDAVASFARSLPSKFAPVRSEFSKFGAEVSSGVHRRGDELRAARSAVDKTIKHYKKELKYVPDDRELVV